VLHGVSYLFWRNITKLKAAARIYVPLGTYPAVFVWFKKFFFIGSYVCDIEGVPGGKDLTSGECSLGQTIPI
jgi:hypothetical protein